MVDKQFWELLKPEHSQAAAFCRKLTGDREEGNDLYHDVVLAAARKFATLKDVSAFRPWLYRILVNRYKNSRRRIWWRRRQAETVQLKQQDRVNDPRDVYHNRRLLKRLLSELSAEDRALVLLHEVEGRPLAELAVMFERPVGTVKTRLHRARRRMYKAAAKDLARSESNSSEEATHAMPRSAEPNCSECN